MQMAPWMLAFGLGLGLLTAGCPGGGSQGGDDGSGDGGGDGDGGGGGVDARVEGPSSVTQSGSRMKMNVLHTPDGAKSFNGWRDTQLNVDCYFQIAGDGAMRCLPTTDTYLTGATYYSDAACTLAAALRPGCTGPDPRYILRYPDQSCPGAGYRIHQAGARLATVYTRSGASCISFTPTPPTSFYSVGPEVPLSSFQSATNVVQ